MSVARSVTACLIGAAIQDGHIGSLDDPVTRYLPQLAGSAYEGVTTRQLLQMASGVQWDETYIYPASDRRRMLPIFSARSWASANLFSQPAPRPEPDIRPATRLNMRDIRFSVLFSSACASRR